MMDYALTEAEQEVVGRTTEELPPIIIDGLQTAQRLRAKVLSKIGLVELVTDLLAQHPEANASPTIDWFGDFVLDCAPEKFKDATPLLRALRTALHEKLDPMLHPEIGMVNYYTQGLKVRVHIKRGCHFKQTGTKTVEQPVYAIECDGEAMPTIEEAATNASL